MYRIPRKAAELKRSDPQKRLTEQAKLVAEAVRELEKAAYAKAKEVKVYREKLPKEEPMYGIPMQIPKKATDPRKLQRLLDSSEAVARSVKQLSEDIDPKYLKALTEDAEDLTELSQRLLESGILEPKRKEPMRRRMKEVELPEAPRRDVYERIPLLERQEEVYIPEKPGEMDDELRAENERLKVDLAFERDKGKELARGQETVRGNIEKCHKMLFRIEKELKK
jgi:hypothetical protein